MKQKITNKTRAAVAEDKCVTVSAMPALPSAANALPALNPYQPTQSMAAPIIVMPGLCGGRRWVGNPLRLPSALTTIIADTPAVA